jgi:hypothetical protein
LPLKGKVVSEHAIELCGRFRVWLHSLLTAALLGGEWSASRPDALLFWETASLTDIGGWVGPTAGLYIVYKI